MFKPLEEFNIKLFRWKTVTEERTIRGVKRQVKKTVKDKEIINLDNIKRKFTLMVSKYKKHIFDLNHQANH